MDLVFVPTANYDEAIKVKKEHNAPKDWKKIVKQKFEDTPTGI